MERTASADQDPIIDIDDEDDDNDQCLRRIRRRCEPGSNALNGGMDLQSSVMTKMEIEPPVEKLADTTTTLGSVCQLPPMDADDMQLTACPLKSTQHDIGTIATCAQTLPTQQIRAVDPTHANPQMHSPVMTKMGIEPPLEKIADTTTALGSVCEPPPMGADDMRQTARPLKSMQHDIATPAQTVPALQIGAVDPAHPNPQMHQMPVCFQSSVLNEGLCRIICYGDSLTAGYCSRGRIFEPYARTLCQTLTRLGIPCNVAVCGLCGKTSEQMVKGLQCPLLSDYLDHKGQGLGCILADRRPNLVIILAGTNDLGRDLGPDGVVADVKRLHAACHACSIPTIALIPPVKLRGSVRTKQQQVAAQLVEWARSASDVAAIFDVEKLVPRKPAGRFWDNDEIHMSVDGQRVFGERLAERLACLPLAQHFMHASTGACHLSQGVQSGQARTLTGLFATKKALKNQDNQLPSTVQAVKVERDASALAATTPSMGSMGSGTSDRASSLAIKQSVQETLTVSGPQQQGLCHPNRAGSTSEPASLVDHISQRSVASSMMAGLSYSKCWDGSGLKGREELSSIMRKLAEGLGKRISALSVNFGNASLKVSLAISGEGIIGEGIGGWCGSIDVTNIEGKGLWGSTIFDALQKLADGALTALGVNNSNSNCKKNSDRTGGGWCGIRSLTTRVQIH